MNLMNSKKIWLTKMKCMGLTTQIKILEQPLRIKMSLLRLFDINTYLKLSLEEMEMLIAKIQMKLREVVNKYKNQKVCNVKEENFTSSKFHNFTIPHFYITWKILKNPTVGRPIVAGYN